VLPTGSIVLLLFAQLHQMQQPQPQQSNHLNGASGGWNVPAAASSSHPSPAPMQYSGQPMTASSPVHTPPNSHTRKLAPKRDATRPPQPQPQPPPQPVAAAAPSKVCAHICTHVLLSSHNRSHHCGRSGCSHKRMLMRCFRVHFIQDQVNMDQIKLLFGSIDVQCEWRQAHAAYSLRHHEYTAAAS